MLKKLHDAAQAVLDLRESYGHSISDEIHAYEALHAAVADAKAELKKTSRKPRKASPKKKA